ncbi:MAG: non-homologous end-joining DNA ligase [Clostridia bacterium]|jgi:DNA ligase D|nr:non-homologous end-joining DNA ligase [Clostridia bacterium]
MTDKLNNYNKKRNFNKTTEPKGKATKKITKPIFKFVVQHHIASRDHFDFRLEWNGVLLSWAVPKGPSYNSDDKRLAIRVEDHPTDYAGFEGIIPQGQYGGGTVMLWDEGSWVPYGSVNQGLKNGTLKFVLNGKRLMGKWALIKIKTDNNKQDNWLLIKEKDQFQNNQNISNFSTSIKTGRTMAQIEKNEEIVKNPFVKIGKQLDKVTDDNITISIEGIDITNPSKIMFNNTNIKKIDIVKYYVKVAKRMLPYLQNRIVSVIRCPKGSGQSCFFKKHPAGTSKGIVSIKVKNGKNADEEYFYINSIYGVIFEAQMNTIEFHTWGSTVNSLEYPDIMVFDLDPDEGMDLKKIRQGVKDLKSILTELSLKSFLKTSGGKGYHIVVPFKPSVNWDTFYKFAKNIAKIMEQKWPERYTSNIKKINRINKIFVDWQRNGRGATTVVPYSLRSKVGTTVSMPISWKELGTIAPNGINIEIALERLKKPDPWKNFYKINQKLKPD